MIYLKKKTIERRIPRTDFKGKIIGEEVQYIEVEMMELELYPDLAKALDKYVKKHKTNRLGAVSDILYDKLKVERNYLIYIS